jgi:hypothetical protein
MLPCASLRAHDLAQQKCGALLPIHSRPRLCRAADRSQNNERSFIRYRDLVQISQSKFATGWFDDADRQRDMMHGLAKVIEPSSRDRHAGNVSQQLRIDRSDPRGIGAWRVEDIVNHSLPFPFRWDHYCSLHYDVPTHNSFSAKPSVPGAHHGRKRLSKRAKPILLNSADLEGRDPVCSSRRCGDVLSRFGTARALAFLGASPCSIATNSTKYFDERRVVVPGKSEAVIPFAPAQRAGPDGIS